MEYRLHMTIYLAPTTIFAERGLLFLGPNHSGGYLDG